MFSKKEKVKFLLSNIKDKFFNEEKFKFNSLKLFDQDYIVKKIGEIEYTYGYDDNGLDYYFILINKNKEGFIWIRSGFKDNGIYSTKDTVIATKNYLEIKNIFETFFNITSLRLLYSEMLGEIEKNKTSFTILNLMSVFTFDSHIRKPAKAKILGLLAFYFFNENENTFEKEIDEGIINDYLYLTDPNQELRFAVNKNTIVSKIVLKEIDYLIENHININSIYDHLSITYGS
jgi:hypothetical protein